MNTETLSVQAKPSALAERLAASARLRQRRFELLPLVGPGAVFTEVQGRAPGDATSDEGLAELISSIAQVGVLQPILVEELAHGAHLLVAGERRLRACRRGAVQDPENPHFQSIPAIVCPGPLAPDERMTWQLIENLARTDLQPGELAAALLFERCALLSVRLEAEGCTIPPDVLAEADPTARWVALGKFKGETDQRHVRAPWSDVIQRLGLQLSEDKVVQLVRAFSQMPPELAEEMDAESIRLSARLSYLKLARNRRDAAAELWAAVKETGKSRLLFRAVHEVLEHPEIDPVAAVQRAEEFETEGNEARADSLRKQAGDARDEASRVTPDVLKAAIDALAALATEMRDGAVVSTYDAGSLRLYMEELTTLLDGARDELAATAVPGAA